MIKLTEKATMLDSKVNTKMNHGDTDRQSPMAGCSDEDHQRYWSATPEERQQTLHNVYENIDPLDPHATFRDHNLRGLEIAAFKKHITSPGDILDFGCGNGYTLLSIAEDLDWPMTGVDYSQNMINGSKGLRKNWQKPLKSDPKFLCEDCIKYISQVPDNSLDYILSARVLLNMPDRETQHQIIRDVYRALKPGGRYLMCEGSATGFEALNDLRETMGLSRIPATSAENLSSLRFVDDEIEKFVSDVGFNLIAKEGFNLYFIISRVVNPLLIAPDSPKFNAPINEIASSLQATQPTQAGLGSNTLWVLEKAT